MPRWGRVLRAMLVTGLTFGAGVGVALASLAAVLFVVRRGDVDREIGIVVVGGSVWAFLIGVAFAGVLALTARGRKLESLSLPRFVALGVGAGLALFGLLYAGAHSAWTLDALVTNFVLFVGMGGGSAAATLLLARRGAARLAAGEPEAPRLEE
ncbi:MAG: hypothetical protein NW201_06665 [Gemmatimonadales bacterium]|nr:hypothetical protein [Gemmatimonadales bacterium]